MGLIGYDTIARSSGRAETSAPSLAGVGDML